MGVSSKKNEVNKPNNNFSFTSNNDRNNNNINNDNNRNSNNRSGNSIINKINSAKTPNDARTIVFGIIDKLEDDIVKLNNKINMLNKEKIDIKHLSDKEIAKLKDVIKKLYMLLSSFYKSMQLSRNDRIKLLHKVKNTIEQNNSFLLVTNQIIKGNQEIEELARTTENKNNMSINEILNEKINNSFNKRNIQEVVERVNNNRTFNNSVIKNNSLMKNNDLIDESKNKNNGLISFTETKNEKQNEYNSNNNIVRESLNGSKLNNFSSSSSFNSTSSSNSTSTSSSGSNFKENIKTNNNSVNKFVNKSVNKNSLSIKINKHQITQNEANKRFNIYKNKL